MSRCENSMSVVISSLAVSIARGKRRNGHTIIGIISNAAAAICSSNPSLPTTATSSTESHRYILQGIAHQAPSEPKKRYDFGYRLYVTAHRSRPHIATSSKASPTKPPLNPKSGTTSGIVYMLQHIAPSHRYILQLTKATNNNNVTMLKVHHRTSQSGQAQADPTVEYFCIPAKSKMPCLKHRTYVYHRRGKTKTTRPLLVCRTQSPHARE
jgi:hypothetical protein